MALTIYDADMAPSSAETQTSGTTLTFSPSSAVTVGKLAVCLVVGFWDPAANETDSTHVTVSDSKSNTWTRAAEAVKDTGQVLGGIYYSVITTEIGTGDSITATWASSVDHKAATLCAFSRDTGKTIEVVDKQYSFGSLASYTVSISGLTSEEHLFVGTTCYQQSGGQDSDSGFTDITQGGGAQWGLTTGTPRCAQGGYKIATGTGETFDNAGPLTNAQRVNLLVAFREVSSGAAVALDPMGMSGFFGA